MTDRFLTWLVCLGVVMTAMLLFGFVVGTAWFLLGIGAAVFFGFGCLCAMAAALNRVFAEDRPVEEYAAPEGGHHVPM